MTKKEKEDQIIRKKIEDMTSRVITMMKDTKTKTVKSMLSKLSKNETLQRSLGFDYRIFQQLISDGVITPPMIELIELGVTSKS